MKKIIFACLILLTVAFHGCEEPPPPSAEEAAKRKIDAVKWNFDLPPEAFNVEELSQGVWGGRWATFHLTVDGKDRKYLIHRVSGDGGVESMVEITP